MTLKLSRGAHFPGEGEACAMEYLSWTRDHKWSAAPACVSSMIYLSVQIINDLATDELTRWRIVDEYGDRIWGSAPVYGTEARWTLEDAMIEFFRREIAAAKIENPPKDDYERGEYRLAGELLAGRYGSMSDRIGTLAAVVARRWAFTPRGLSYLDRLLTAYDRASNLVPSS